MFYRFFNSLNLSFFSYSGLLELQKFFFFFALQNPRELYASHFLERVLATFVRMIEFLSFAQFPVDHSPAHKFCLIFSEPKHQYNLLSVQAISYNTTKFYWFSITSSEIKMQAHSMMFYCSWCIQFASKLIEKKPRRELHKNATSHIEQVGEAAPYKAAAVRPITSHLVV